MKPCETITMKTHRPASVARLRRREMLAALLGLPAMLSGCGKTQEIPLPAGRFVGPSDKLGHRLRKKDRPSPASDGWQQTRGVIVGGGIAGLAAAWRLAKSGFRDFVLLELEPYPGGTSASGRCEIAGFPWAAHYVPVPMKENRALVSLLEEMGVLEGRDDEGEPIVAEKYLCRDPQERIFYKGRWYEGIYLSAGSNATDRQQLAAFQAEMDRWAACRDGSGRRAFAIPISCGSDDPEVTSLDAVSMSEWMDRRGWNSDAPPLAGKLLLPRRLRDEHRAHQRLGGRFLFCFPHSPAGAEIAASDNVARRKRPRRGPHLRAS